AAVRRPSVLLVGECGKRLLGPRALRGGSQFECSAATTIADGGSALHRGAIEIARGVHGEETVRARAVGSTLKFIKETDVPFPCRGALQRENGSATKSAVRRAAASGRSSVEDAVGVGDEVRVRKASVRSALEIVDHGVGPIAAIGREFEDGA